MRIFKKKNKTTKVQEPDPVYYPVLPGQEVTLTIRGTWDGQRVDTLRGSYFILGAGARQIDPAVWVEPYEGVI